MFTVGKCYTFTFDSLINLCSEIKKCDLFVYPSTDGCHITLMGGVTVDEDEILNIVSVAVKDKVTRIYKDYWNKVVTFF